MLFDARITIIKNRKVFVKVSYGAFVTNSVMSTFRKYLGVGFLTLNKWVQKHQHDYLMSGPHENVEKENTRPR